MPMMMNKFKFMKIICHHGVQSSGVSSSNESVNITFVQIIFQYSAFSYSYGVVVESIWIDDSIDAAHDFDDDHSQGEKGTKCTQNNAFAS